MPQVTSPNIASPQFKATSHQFYARLRAEAPVFRTTVPGNQPAWLVSRYDDVAALLKDERFAGLATYRSSAIRSILAGGDFLRPPEST